MSYSIGVLGGMGTYATIHFFQQYAEVFQAKKEWERPRIIIDNRCTMPSRVRAFLYDEKKDLLIDEMTESMNHLVDAGCNRLILACNTSHIFLPQIYHKAPKLEGKIANIIDICVESVEQDCVKTIYLLGSEGMIDSNIYQNVLEAKGIKCLYPMENDYVMIRECIEAVKQNNYSEGIVDKFLELINRHESCILGCTELPILYERYKSLTKCNNGYDPLLLGLLKLKEEFDNEKNTNIWGL